MADFFNQTLGLPIPFLRFDGTSPVNATFVVDASDKSTASVFWAPAGLVITHLFSCISAVTGTVTNIARISLQGLSTTGNPDGTIKGGGTPAEDTYTPTVASTWQVLDNSYTVQSVVNGGEYLCIVLENLAGTPASNNFTVVTTNSIGDGASVGQPYSLTETGAAWTKVTTLSPIYGFKTASRTYGMPLAVHATAAPARTMTTTVEIGNLINLSSSYGSTYNIIGADIYMGNIPTGNTYWLGLYSGVTLLQQAQMDSDFSGIVNNAGIRAYRIYFGGALSSLSFGNTYTLGICASSGSSGALAALDVLDAGDQSAFALGTQMYGRNRTLGTPVTTSVGPVSGETAWTDESTRRYKIFPVISDWTIAGASGAGPFSRIYTGT